jgi:hypothetical protein
MNILSPLLFLLIPLFGLMFFIRVLLGPFSPKIWEQMRKHPILHLVWGLFSILSFYFVFVFIPYGPPAWVDRIDQRKKLQERVNTAGGWIAIRQDCTLFVSNRTDFFYWFPPATNVQVTSFSNNVAIRYTTNLNYGTLPPALAALKPRGMEYRNPVMQIRLFGMHSSGGHSTPYFGLEIVCSTNAPEYRPKVGGSGGASGNHHSTYEQVAEGVFEIY